MRPDLTSQELDKELWKATWFLATILDMPFGNDDGRATMIARFMHLAGLRYGVDRLNKLVAEAGIQHERYVNEQCVVCGKPWTGQHPCCDACESAMHHDLNHGFSGGVAIR